MKEKKKEMIYRDFIHFLTEAGIQPKIIREFMKFLMFNNAYDRFLLNTWRQNFVNENSKCYLYDRGWIRRRDCLWAEEIINYLLIWEITLEKHSFWNSLHDKWFDKAHKLLKK